MVRRWKEIIGAEEGVGTLTDKAGSAVDVTYELTVRQNMRERRPAINAPTTVAAGTCEASGTLISEDSTLALNTDGDLILEMEDSRRVGVLLRSLLVAGRRCEFVVSREMDLFEHRNLADE